MLMTHYRQPIDWQETNSQRASDELEEWSDLLQGYYSFRNEMEPIEIVQALTDDLNTPEVLAVLRRLFVKAKKGGHEDLLTFAASCKLLGFRNLDKPGFFRFGVSALNIGPENLFTYEAAVQKLRAALANNASDVQSEILSSIRSNGLNIEISNGGDLTLVRGDQESLKQKVESLVAERTSARSRKDWKESDRIRDKLAAMGVVLKDSKDGTTWEVAR
jgi:cysteinyl-tRNA synthetase